MAKQCNGMLGSVSFLQEVCIRYPTSYMSGFIAGLGKKRSSVRSDKDRSLLRLIDSVSTNVLGVELVLMTSPEGDHAANGSAEVGVRESKARTRRLRSQVEQRLGNRIDDKVPLSSWIPPHAEIVCPDTDGRRSHACGKTWKRPVVEFGESVHFRPAGENNAMRGGDQRMCRGVHVSHHERSGAAIFITPDGVKRGTRIARVLEHERWEPEFTATEFHGSCGKHTGSC